MFVVPFFVGVREILQVFLALLYFMEDLTKRWGKMSLNDREEGRACLKKELGIDEYIIAAKFQTKRALNIEANIPNL